MGGGADAGTLYEVLKKLRNPMGRAQMAFHRLRQTELTESRTVAILERGLRRTSEMIDSVLSHASLKMGVVPRLGPIALRAFLHEIEVDAGVEAQAKNIK